MIFPFCIICGHGSNKHVYLDEVILRAKHVQVCGDCKPILDNSHEYKQDNLKYLEQLYDIRERT
jgi:hypothetical protein